MTHSSTAVSGVKKKRCRKLPLPFVCLLLFWEVGEGLVQPRGLVYDAHKVYDTTLATHILRPFKQFHKFRLKSLQF